MGGQVDWGLYVVEIGFGSPLFVVERGRGDVCGKFGLVQGYLREH